jgi:hypothetical protein
MNEVRNTLVQLPSGTIDLVIEERPNINRMLLQYNCSCIEALPYCQAMCCRMQQFYSAKITKEEAETLAHTRIVKDILVMPTKQDNSSECEFLSDEKKCKIHFDKPQACKEWHCSPKGVGDNLKVRAQGWILLPTQE